MFKDKDKQREANKQAKARQRAKKTYNLAVELGMTPKGMTKEDNVIPKTDIRVIPERTPQGNIRVSKPGDADYEPQCETTRAFIEGRDKRPEAAKRGKDIKLFSELPLDVKRTIVRLTTKPDGGIDHSARANRTAIAINYQHQFPGLYYTRGFNSDRSNRMGVITDG